MGNKYKIMIIALGIMWSIFLLTLLNKVGDREKQLVNEIAVSQSRGLFQLMVNMRSWNAHYGGVYVPVTDDSPPNEYLTHPRRDLVASDGTERPASALACRPQEIRRCFSSGGD